MTCPRLCMHGFTKAKGCRFGCRLFNYTHWSCDGTGVLVIDWMGRKRGEPCRSAEPKEGLTT